MFSISKLSKYLDPSSKLDLDLFLNILRGKIPLALTRTVSVMHFYEGLKLVIKILHFNFNSITLKCIYEHY